MRRTFQMLAAGLLAATGLTLSGAAALAQPPGFRPYPQPTGPIRIQPQIPPPMPYPYPGSMPLPYPYPYPVPAPVPIPRYCDTDFVVLVKCPIHRDWKPYGRYATFQQAKQVECFLERQGAIARIERVRECRYW